MRIPLVIIGSGLSGLAAAIRYARFSPNVLLLERHSRIGGLNSYFYRNKVLIETGLHAITNYASQKDRKAPLNQIFRQLKLNRKMFRTHEQIQSEICFVGRKSLLFSNDVELLRRQIHEKFPNSAKEYDNLLAAIKAYPAFKVGSFKSAKTFLQRYITDPLLIQMLLCPLFFYGSSLENDMDLSQFIIMFRSIFQEGLFRPEGTIKDFLDLLLNRYLEYGGKLRMQTEVKKIIHEGKNVRGVELTSGEVIFCDQLISTIGLDETLTLLDQKCENLPENRIGFVESIFHIPYTFQHKVAADRTIIFFNNSDSFNYMRPERLADLNSGVICFPSNFTGLTPGKYFEIRSTHLANFASWKAFKKSPDLYREKKTYISKRSTEAIENIIGNFSENIVYENTFTPLTIERFTAKKEGAIYGRPHKIKDGKIGYDNLFLAGTDQGFLGIIGSMMSGISMVNQHILPSL